MTITVTLQSLLGESPTWYLFFHSNPLLIHSSHSTEWFFFNHYKSDHFTPLLRFFPWFPTVLRIKSKLWIAANRQAPTRPNPSLPLQLPPTSASCPSRLSLLSEQPLPSPLTHWAPSHLHSLAPVSPLRQMLFLQLFTLSLLFKCHFL